MMAGVGMGDRKYTPGDSNVGPTTTALGLNSVPWAALTHSGEA